MKQLKIHQQQLSQCTLCPNMIGPVIIGNTVKAKILLVGQAPGDREGNIGKPFAWTAGKTLFKWFSTIGVNEDTFRKNVYMSAVCRCFPGKKPKGGDRVPSNEEIKTCSRWINAEIELLQPELIIAVGKLAINQYIHADKLVDVIGQSHTIDIKGLQSKLIPLPHPSGASTWHRKEPGISLLDNALKEIEKQPCWQQIIQVNGTDC